MLAGRKTKVTSLVLLPPSQTLATCRREAGGGGGGERTDQQPLAPRDGGRKMWTPTDTQGSPHPQDRAQSCWQAAESALGLLGERKDALL